MALELLGGCRVVVDGKAVFACVDGPEFDAHAVDFDILKQRNRVYRSEEEISLRDLECNYDKISTKNLKSKRSNNMAEFNSKRKNGYPKT
jgi:hypothetical protein